MPNQCRRSNARGCDTQQLCYHPRETQDMPAYRSVSRYCTEREVQLPTTTACASYRERTLPPSPFRLNCRITYRKTGHVLQAVDLRDLLKAVDSPHDV